MDIVPFQGRFSGPRRSRRTSSFWVVVWWRYDLSGGFWDRGWVVLLMAMRSTDFVEFRIRWAKNC